MTALFCKFIGPVRVNTPFCLPNSDTVLFLKLLSYVVGPMPPVPLIPPSLRRGSPRTYISLKISLLNFLPVSETPLVIMSMRAPLTDLHFVSHFVAQLEYPLSRRFAALS